MTTDISCCHLTTGDHLVLEAMNEHHHHRDTFFAQMLRSKIRNARLYLRDDIPKDVATLNSWVTYAINGTVIGPVQLVHPAQGDAAGNELSIRALHGLALLGLAEGARESLQSGDGQPETITLVKVAQVFDNGGSNRAADVKSRPAGEIVPFRARKTPAPTPPWSPSDDPGPTAA